MGAKLVEHRLWRRRALKAMDDSVLHHMLDQEKVVSMLARAPECRRRHYVGRRIKTFTLSEEPIERFTTLSTKIELLPRYLSAYSRAKQLPRVDAIENLIEQCSENDLVG